jgi:hypothetical protein
MSAFSPRGSRLSGSLIIMISSIRSSLLRRVVFVTVALGALAACQKNDASAGQVAGKVNDVAQAAGQKLDQAASYVAVDQYRPQCARFDRPGQFAECGQRNPGAARQGCVADRAEPRNCGAQIAGMVGAELGVLNQCFGIFSGLGRFRRRAKADGQVICRALRSAAPQTLRRLL